MASRNERASIAAQTVQILSTGSYAGPSGKTVSILPELNYSVNETRLFAPGQLAKIAAARPSVHATPQIRVTNCTTLDAARQLHAAHGPERVALLNFASARNPGGGFLSGSQAQEESLARASGLYASISRMTDYYGANRRTKSALYTDHMIYSPLVPVFRDDADRLLDEPWTVSMITAPAVNAGVVRSQESENVSRIRDVMDHRIACVLALAAHHGHDALVLGAWGCGVFANDPREVAELFAGHLLGQGRYATAFTEVVFAVLDRRGDVLRPFAEAFGNATATEAGTATERPRDQR
jgi:uncharacterized protein (TIGR02452 family)